jgi:hypothetical protein
MAESEVPWEGTVRSIRSFLVRRKREGRGVTAEEVDELLTIIDRECLDESGSGE